MLEKLKVDRTILIVAHRLSTIRNADMIIVVDRGEVLEFGTHAELMNKNGFYFDLITIEEEKQKKVENEKYSIRLENQNLNSQSCSSTSTISSLFNKKVDQSVEIDENKNRFYSQPVMMKILRLNLPELHWIVFGCIASLIFGATMPVSHNSIVALRKFSRFFSVLRGFIFQNLRFVC